MRGERTRLVYCDFCTLDGIMRPAKYDGRTTAGLWAFMCEAHFLLRGVGLGLGRGQQLKRVEIVRALL